MTARICPLMSRPVAVTIGMTKFEPVECQKEKCQFWISVYSTEGLKQSPECAIVLRSLVNADGLVVV